LHSFDSFRIRLYFGDHGIPHVHLIGPDCAAVITIETGDVIAGGAPAAATRMAREWVSANRQMLLGMWRN